MSDVDTSTGAAERLAKRLRARLLYESHGEASSLPDEAAAILEVLAAERDALRLQREGQQHTNAVLARTLAECEAERDAARAEVARLREAAGIVMELSAEAHPVCGHEREAALDRAHAAILARVEPQP